MFTSQLLSAIEDESKIIEIYFAVVVLMYNSKPNYMKTEDVKRFSCAGAVCFTIFDLSKGKILSTRETSLTC